jgi:hypothetical protein
MYNHSTEIVDDYPRATADDFMIMDKGFEDWQM